MLISRKKNTAVRLFTPMLPILFGIMVVTSYGQAPAPQPDNTKVNQRDRSPSEPTADQQKMNKTDRDLASSIRKSIMDDKSLSTYAHNVKVISQDGTVTLKGPVKSEEEKKSVMTKATEVAGSAAKVHDEMSVKP